MLYKYCFGASSFLHQNVTLCVVVNVCCDGARIPARYSSRYSPPPPFFTFAPSRHAATFTNDALAQKDGTLSSSEDDLDDVFES